MAGEEQFRLIGSSGQTSQARRLRSLSDSVKLHIGDIIHNEVTNEVGRIVRIDKVNGQLGYIVVIATKPFAKEIEALWRPRELKELRDRARRWRPSAEE